jgi:uncharacterized protein YtpQ (UPF0354 family)
MVRLIALVVLACWAGIALAQEGPKVTPDGAAPKKAARKNVEVLSKQAFTERMAQGLAEKLPAVKFSVAGELAITSIDAEGRESTGLLNDVYGEYTNDPAKLRSLIAKVARRMKQGAAGCCPKLDLRRIVPVIKDRPWLEQNRRVLHAKDPSQDFVFEDFIDDLIVVYAVDGKRAMRYLMANESFGDRKDLRTRAVDNLWRILPKVEVHKHGDLIAYVSAGGNYESSLLLSDTMWRDGQIKFDGETVIAIPARGALLVTGSSNHKGVSAVRELAAKVAAESSYRLTDKLFVYRDGRFVRFDP